MSLEKPSVPTLKKVEKDNIDQDVIAKSYLSHVSIYKELVEKERDARNKYYLTEKSNGPDHPETIETKKEWDDIYSKREKQGNLMNTMLESLTEETLEKYKKDFELRGAINPNP